MGIQATMDSNGNRFMLHTDHPDTIRMNWLQKNNGVVTYNYCNAYIGFSVGTPEQEYVDAKTLRGAIDKAMRVSRKVYRQENKRRK